MMSRALTWFDDNVLLYRGSTRGAALIRIALVCLLWRKFGAKLVLVRAFQDIELLPYALIFWCASTMMLIGLYSRTSSLLTGFLCIWMYHWLGIGQGDNFWIHHHIYLLNAMTLFIGFTDCGNSFSLDRWLAVRKAQKNRTPIPPEEGELWGLRLISFQISMCYIFGAWDKTHLAFGDRVEHYLMTYVFGSDYPVFPGFTAFCILSAILTVGAEYWLAVALHHPRQRAYAVVVGIILHLIFFQILLVSTFSATMILAYLAFIRPASIHSFIDRLVAREPAPHP